MSRVEIVSHQRKNIIHIDLSQSLPENSVAALRDARAIIAKTPLKSALVLTDVTGATYNREVAEAVKDFVKFNTPFIKASAVVGADGVRGVLLGTVVFLTRREIRQFNTIQEAKDWLTTF